MARPPAIQPDTGTRITLNVRNVGLTDDQFDRLCCDNRDLRIEMTAEKELIIMSPTYPETDRKKAKMEEYIANGSRLGWLLDPIENRATIYRSGQSPQRIDNPTIITGDPVLPGFKFDFREIL